MLKFMSLGSGSSGNCYYLNTDGYGLLIDAGIGGRTLRRQMANYGLPVHEIKEILVTHDHADHVLAVGMLAASWRVPVFALEDTYAGMKRNRYMRKKVPDDLARRLCCGEALEHGPFRIEAFHVPHDSMACCGYLLQAGDVSFCLATDVGHVTDELRTYLARARYVVMEANYDAAMLAAGRYPAFLKNRITGERGHTSNAEAAELLATTLRRDAAHVWLCHLSEENNRPDLALAAVTQSLASAGYDLAPSGGLIVEALPRTTPSRLYELL